jgi:hypothetical protein
MIHPWVEIASRRAVLSPEQTQRGTVREFEIEDQLTDRVELRLTRRTHDDGRDLL